MRQKQRIDQAIQVVQENLSETRTVADWAELMGYNCPKNFSRMVRNYFDERPLKLLNNIKLKKAIYLLSNTSKSAYDIGFCELGVGDEKAFWQYMKYHTGYSPSQIRSLKKRDINYLVEKLDSKINE